VKQGFVRLLVSLCEIPATTHDPPHARAWMAVRYPSHGYASGSGYAQLRIAANRVVELRGPEWRKL